MFCKINGAGILGVDGYLIDVEVDLSKGLPAFNIVGLPDASLKEAKERVKSAIMNSGFVFPNRRIVVNLSPADIRKEGSYFDVAIALGILQGEILREDDFISKSVFIGELSLDGKIKKVKGALSIVINAKENNLKRVFLPSDNLKEASLIEGIELIGLNNLKDLIKILKFEKKIDIYNEESIVHNKECFDLDFSDVKGNSFTKRAAEISAAGNHNMLMIGCPGSGKTMIAKRFNTIMPDLSFDEILEINKIYSSSGLIKHKDEIIKTRPFRAPHHTVTRSALIGGGNVAKSGEVALAHKGILFLDELLEFDKATLDTLRQPLEEKYINISRVKMNVRYEADFLLIAAMNPCSCGYYRDINRECTCNSKDVKRYLNKISGPLLDRVDLFVEVPFVEYSDYAHEKKEESSDSIKSRVISAREVQKTRYINEGFSTNSQLKSNNMEKYCKLNPKSQELLKQIYNKLKLSSRSYHKLLSIARTIADLEGNENIEYDNLAESISYRKAYYNYWK